MRTGFQLTLSRIALSMAILTAASSVAHAQWSYSIYDNPGSNTGVGQPYGALLCSGVTGSSIGLNITDSDWDTLCPALAAKSDDHFGAQFTQFINVVSAGNYSFHLGSDDGSGLYLDGSSTDFLNVFGNHPFESADGSVFMSVGEHEVDALYYEWEGSQELAVSHTDAIHGTPTRPTVVGTPEPASVALMLTGFSILGGAGVRKRRNQKASK